MDGDGTSGATSVLVWDIFFPGTTVPLIYRRHLSIAVTDMINVKGMGRVKQGGQGNNLLCFVLDFVTFLRVGPSMAGKQFMRGATGNLN